MYFPWLTATENEGIFAATRDEIDSSGHLYYATKDANAQEINDSSLDFGDDDEPLAF